MNFLHQGFRKLSCDRQTDSPNTETICHDTSQYLNASDQILFFQIFNVQIHIAFKYLATSDATDCCSSFCCVTSSATLCTAANTSSFARAAPPVTFRSTTVLITTSVHLMSTRKSYSIVRHVLTTQWNNLMLFYERRS